MSSDTAPAPVNAPGRRRWPIVLGVVVGLVLAAWTGTALALGSTIPEGTTISGVPVGGKTPGGAERALRQAFASRARGALQVTAGDAASSVSLAEAGLTLDAAASVAEVKVTPWHPLRALRGGSTVQAVTKTDDKALAAVVHVLAATLDRPAREPTIRFSGLTPVVVAGTKGLRLDQARSMATLRRDWLVAATPVALPSVVTTPTVADREVQRALSEVAQPAVSAPVIVVGGTASTASTATVTPATVAASLTFTAQDGKLVANVDSATVANVLASRLGAAVRPAKNATFRIVAGKPQVVPSQPGRDVDRAKLGPAMLSVLTKPAPREVAAPVTDTAPTFTTEQAKALNIVDKLSSYTTHYPYAAYRLHNIHRAADLIDGTLLKPGQEFSLNRIVGERTAKNDFAVGIVIKGGKFAKDFGGGVSQVATTTFNAMFFAGLDEVEHRPHSFWISRYPAGREATVAWGSLDLRFRNDTPDGVLVTTSYSRSTVTVSMWGTKRYDIESVSSGRYRVRSSGSVTYDPSAACVHQDPVAGFDIDVTRVFRQEGAVVRKETFHTSYEPAQEILCRAAPRKATPTPSPSSGAAPPGATPKPGTPKPVTPKPVTPKPVTKPGASPRP